MAEHSVIGKRLPMTDALDKVTGAGKYADDLSVPGMLFGRILHSPHAHARIRSMDTSRAEALPGVKAVCTGRDAPNPYGILPIGHDERVFALDKARYIGDNVAAVAATSPEIAEQALELIAVDWEILPSWFDPLKSMEAAAGWIHEEKPRNIEKEYHHEFGSVESGFAQADFVREEHFYAAEVTHVAMEPHSTLATWEPEGRLIVYSSTQVPYYLHRTLSEVCEMPMSHIRVVKPLVGGGFGGKSEVIPLEVAAAVLAKKAKRAVKITYSREEVFYAHRGRPITIVDLKLGLTREGKITAVAARVVQDGGAYCGYGPVTVLYSGALLGAIYDILNVKYDGFRVLTNKPACGAMRGHGTVNVRFAFESLLDELAAEAGLDPVDVRRQNLLQAPCLTVNQLRVTSYGLPECLEKVKQASGWDERRGHMPKGRGLGLGCAHFVSGTSTPKHWTGEPHATVNLKVDFDGGLTIFTGAADIGQGSSTMAAQVVAEVLGVDIERIGVIAADSALTPKDNGSYSSRVTFMVGNAALHAAEQLKEMLAKAAARKLEAHPSDIVSHDEHFMVVGNQDKGLSFGDVVKEALVDTGTITVKGIFVCPQEFMGDKKIRGSAIGATMGFCYSAQVVEAEVDEISGKVRPIKVWVAVDVGKALNPLAVEGQIQGGVWMGMGQALLEETRFDDGRMLHANLIDYRVPTMQDSPDIEVIVVESIDPNGPFGAKEASEGMLAGFLPAVMDAVHEATGIRPDQLPLCPERMAEYLDAQEAAP